MSKRDYTPWQGPVLPSIQTSGLTFELSIRDWPDWAQRTPVVQRVFGRLVPNGEIVPSTRTAARPIAQIIVERYDSKDSEPFNYDQYFVVEAPSGTAYQSAPRKRINFGHHLSRPVSDSSLLLQR